MPQFMIALFNMQLEFFCQFITMTKKMVDVSTSVATEMKPAPVIATVNVKKGGCVGPADLRQ